MQTSFITDFYFTLWLESALGTIIFVSIYFPWLCEKVKNHNCNQVQTTCRIIMQLKILTRVLPHYTQMVSIWWLTYPWDKTAGLTDFWAKLLFGGFGGVFLASTTSGIPESSSVQFELYPKPWKRPRGLYISKKNLVSSLRTHQSCWTLSPTSMKAHFLIPTFIFIAVFS